MLSQIEPVDDPTTSPPEARNRQLWENSPMNGSAVFDRQAEDGERLFNSKDPNFGILSEKPEHRLIILLKAQGHSNVEIAKLTGYTNVWVGQILRQPWAKERLLDEINKQGREAVQTLLEGSAVDSIYRIVDLRDNSSEDGVRLRAAQDLLDRHLGKATQHVESRTTTLQTTIEIKALDAELARLEEQERLLLGPSRVVEANS